MCVGGSIGIWVAGFGSASPNPLFRSRSSLRLRTRHSLLVLPVADLRRVSFRLFAALCRAPLPARSINLGKQSSLDRNRRVPGSISAGLASLLLEYVVVVQVQPEVCCRVVILEVV